MASRSVAEALSQASEEETADVAEIIAMAREMLADETVDGGALQIHLFDCPVDQPDGECDCTPMLVALDAEGGS